MFSRGNAWAEERLGKMNLDEKVGQLLVFSFCGPVITPDIIELIEKYQLGGLRVSQKFRTTNLFHDVKPGEEPDAQLMKSMYFPVGTNRDYAYMSDPVSCTAAEYAGVLNELRKRSMDRPSGVPLHFTSEHEGSGSDDQLSGQRLFPHPMGITATGDPRLAYKRALAIGRQLKALGINMVHQPCIDVNTNPKNPEIGTRAYADNPDETIRFALETLRGFQEAGIFATAKHFPGRGESESDAHWGLPSVDLSYDGLMQNHIRPYRALIEAGVPAIMTAHCRYPALGVDTEPGSVTKRIVNELLREELGFSGLVVTDNTMMGGLLKNYTLPEAVVRTIMAGHDIVLMRDESPSRIAIIEAVKLAVQDGRIPVRQLDDSVKRVLAARYVMGLAENGGLADPTEAQRIIDDPFVVETARETAEKSVTLMRDRTGAVPIAREARVLLIEQIFPTQKFSNNLYSHPGLLWEEMCRLSNKVASVETEFIPTDEDILRIKRRLNEADLIVMTCYYYHKYARTISDLVDEIAAECGKPMIVVSNTPYPTAVKENFDTVVLCYNPGGREQIRATAEVLFGRLKATAKVPVALVEA